MKLETLTFSFASYFRFLTIAYEKKTYESLTGIVGDRMNLERRSTVDGSTQLMSCKR